MSAGRIANALSGIRLIVSTLVALYVAFTAPNWWWFVGIGLVVASAFTEPIDGRIARKGTPDKNGKVMNEVGTIGLSIVLPGALLVHQLIGRFWLHWPGSTTSNLAVWFAECVIFVAATLFVFNRARAVLAPRKAERFEVWQAWFTAVIVVCCVQEMFQLAWSGLYGVKPPIDVMFVFWLTTASSLGIVATLSGDRFLHRKQELDDKLYKGTKQHLYRRG
jgi:phosphatidylglycerophosphate synthase